MVDDDSLDQLVHMGLTRDLVMTLRDRHECGAEADGQVIGVHHVVLTVLGKTAEKHGGKNGKGKSEMFLGGKQKCTSILQLAKCT